MYRMVRALMSLFNNAQAFIQLFSRAMYKLNKALTV
jgi:hypothetical protein